MIAIMNKKRLSIFASIGVLCAGIIYVTLYTNPDVSDEVQSDTVVEEHATGTIPAEVTTATGYEAAPVDDASVQHDEAGIMSSFAQYKSGLLEKKSNVAIQQLSQGTIDYYAKILDMVKNGTKADIQKQPLVDQINILLPRFLFDASVLGELHTGKDMLVLAIDNGLIDENSVSNLTISKINIVGKTASVEVNTEHGVAPQKLQFIKENNVWKMDLTSILPATNAVLESVIASAGMTQGTFLMEIFERKYGKKPGDEIWEPLE